MDMNSNLTAVIMAGGAGTRFWPVSTAQKPKQFLNLLGGRTLIQQSFDRLKGLVAPERIFVFTNERFVDLVHEQLPELKPEQIIGEPYRKDTAGAVALAAMLVKKLFGNSTMLILTADHKIDPTDKFQVALRSAVQGAQESGVIYTLGIKPTYAATNYGYLECGQRLDVDSQAESPAHYELIRFKEKPKAEQAEQFLNSGNFYWNSGMFIWQTDTILEEFARQLPAHLEALKPALEAYSTPTWPKIFKESFAKLEKISLDYAIMEHAQEVRMVESNFNWLDLGGWLAVAPFLNHDQHENSSRGGLYVYESNHNIVFTDNPQTNFALVGLENMAVIQSGSNILAVPLNRLDDVKKLVDILPENLK